MNRRRLFGLLSLIPFVKLKPLEKCAFIQKGESEFVLLETVKFDEPIAVRNGETLIISYTTTMKN